MTRRWGAVGLALAVLGQGACQISQDRSETGSIDGRVHKVGRRLTIQDGHAGGLRSKTFQTSGLDLGFVYVASVDAPTVRGVRVQATNFAFDARYAYVTYNMHGERALGALDIVDLAVPEAPRLVSSIAFRDSEYADVVVRDGTAYLAGADGFGGALTVVDVRDREHPAIVRTVSVGSYYATSIAAAGTDLYVTTGDGGGGLVKVDVAVPSEPRVVGVAPLDNALYVGRGTDATFVIGGQGSLDVYKVSSGLERVGRVADAHVDAPGRFAVVGDHLLTNAGKTGLSVLDLESGAVTAHQSLDGTGNGIAAIGGVAFLAQGEAGTEVVDVQASPPEVLGGFDFPDDRGSANDVRVGNIGGRSFIFVSDGLGGFRVVSADRMESLLATALSGSEIVLAWPEIGASDGTVTVERSDDDGATFTTVVVLPATERRIVDSRLKRGRRYTYRVTANPSSTDTSSAPGSDPAPPPSPAPAPADPPGSPADAWTGTATATTIDCTPKTPPPTRAMWVWGYYGARERELLEYVDHKGLNTVYLNTGPTFVAKAEQNLPSLFAKLALANVKAHVLLSNYKWARRANHAAALADTDAAIAFLDTLDPVADGRPVALHFDIEPDSLPEWKSDRNGIANAYLDLLEQLRDRAHAANLELVMDMGSWYDIIDVTRNGVTRPLSHWVIDVADSVTALDYRDHVQGDDGLIQMVVSSVAYSDSVCKPIVVGVETQCGVTHPSDTFCEEGEMAMLSALSEVESRFEPNNSFVGYAVHYLNSWQNLQP